MTSIAAVVLLTACMAVPAVCQSDLEPRRPGQEAFLERAVFADGTLWVLSDAGVLTAITEATATAAEVPLPEPVLDLCLVHGKAAVITGARDGGEVWTLRVHAGGSWLDATSIPRESEQLLRACSVNGMVTVLTSRRLIEVDGNSRRGVALSEPIEPGKGQISSLLVTPEAVFAGLDMGEWGGGLRRVDRRSGKVTVIEKQGAGPCDGPLNTACDPVTGIAREPWNPECFAVAIGLQHMADHGRIVEVCGETVQRLYFKSAEPPSAKAPPDSAEEAFMSMPFYGLVSAGGHLSSVSTDGLYRFSAGGEVQLTPLPEFQRIGPFDVSFAQPDVVLVLSGIQQRHSVGGLVPMLVPR